MLAHVLIDIHLDHVLYLLLLSESSCLQEAYIQILHFEACCGTLSLQGQEEAFL